MIEHYACYRDYRKNMVFTEQMFKEVLTKLQQQFPRFDPTAIIIKEKES
jgi:lysyl-tRNA synthetase class II